MPTASSPATSGLCFTRILTCRSCRLALRATRPPAGCGLGISCDGSFLAFSDNSMVNGGGRVLIFHNEQLVPTSFAITGGLHSGQQVQLSWSSAGAASYTVQRGLDVANAATFQTIATNLNARQFTDTNAPAAGAYYRVVATPAN